VDVRVFSPRYLIQSYGEIRIEKQEDFTMADTRRPAGSGAAENVSGSLWSPSATLKL